MANRKSPTRGGSRQRHSYSDYRRLTPTENEMQGRSRKARHYVLKNVKRVTLRTPSITARAHETMRARQVHASRLLNKPRLRVEKVAFPIPVRTKQAGWKRPLIEGWPKRRKKASASISSHQIPEGSGHAFISRKRK